MNKVRAIFNGKVQGVFFRANCQRKAVELGINGWVKNLPDGDVEMFAEGEKGSLQKLVDWCRHSQPFAVVDEVKEEWDQAISEFSEFKIRI